MIRIVRPFKWFGLLPMMFNLRRSVVPKSLTRDLEIDDLNVSVLLRRNAQARRFILKIGKQHRQVIVTMPSNGSEAEAMDFAISQAHWIKSRIEAQPDIVTFVPGAEIPLRGVIHTIDHRPGERGTVWIDEDSDGALISVAGDQRHLTRRLRDWLKKQARHDLTRCVDTHSRHLNLRPKSLTIRDQRTRWGSCSSSGGLSFSWRLIFAPTFVLDYVAAHEVAHLKEMNHGPQFWRLVEQCIPDYKRAQKWLKHDGAKLHFYGK